VFLRFVGHVAVVVILFVVYKLANSLLFILPTRIKVFWMCMYIIFCSLCMLKKNCLFCVWYIVA